ncbi:beta-ketoacyl synthase domain-containing protein [Phaeosphaeriaceae sp. PMI808]|nr:beta-ketoacyl synthase domain-containing protein [Phaeosphaeriaceae sp. PMI808]
MDPQSQHEAVAIVGMGCRWPGGVRNAPDLWEFLKNRVDGWQEFDDPRFSTRGFHHPNTDRPGTMAMRGAYLINEDARLFDHTFFNITALEVETMDPSQRKLLEVTYEAIENAGETWESVSGSRTGVFVGNFCLDHWMIQSRDWDNPRPYAFTGAGTSILANRISYVFNLNGPSLTVDTACSSSMYALHLAMNAIRAGDCDAAVVASANWIADPGVQIALDKLGALSASGRSHTFDARAEGYARGEGYGAIYLKRASLAISDGSPIRALVRGSSMNANGRTGGITRPSPAGQEAVIREAYRNAGLSFADTRLVWLIHDCSYFECHGTGTYVGDPLEVAAVGNVFAKERPAGDPLLVGSTKTNLGHGEGASALASIMKVVLSLEHEAIPPIYNLETLNPNIDFKGAAVKVVENLTNWPSDKVRRASINSFGYGGANAHCIIDHVNTLFPDYVKPGVFKKKTANGAINNRSVIQVALQGVDTSPEDSAEDSTDDSAEHSKHSSTSVSTTGSTNGSTDKLIDGKSKEHHPIIKAPKTTRIADADTRQLVLLPFAAHNKESLELNIDSLRDAIDRFQLAEVAYTLATKRSRLPQRTFRVVDKSKPAEGLSITRNVLRSPLQPGKVAFVFTGQGAQWAAMGAELFEYRVFRTAISYLDHVLNTLPAPPKWKLHEILSGQSEPEFIQGAEISQTVCTALQIGLVDLLASWSVRPVAVAGHSSGEIAAAYASGLITAAEAIVAAYFRGQAVSKNKQKGLMLAVGLGPEKTLPYLAGQEKKVRIAAYNSPGSVTLSGDTDAIEELAKVLDKNGVFNRILKTGGNAYHSHHMLPLGLDYDAMLSEGLAHVQKLGLADASQRYAQIPWMSSVTPGKTLSEADFAGPTYWRANLESPVRFSEAVTDLVSSGDVQVLVEIGPHPALKSPIDQILKEANKTSISYSSGMKRQQDSRESMLQLAGTLFCMNTDVNLVAVNALDSVGGLTHGSIAIDLPPYQYAYGPVSYHESRQSKEYRYREVIRHDLLGSKVVGNAKLRPQWRNILRMKDVPWLGDHRLLPDAVLPAAAYIAMAVEAASRINNEQSTLVQVAGYSLREVSIKSSLQIPEDDYGVEVVTTMELLESTTSQAPTWATFSVSTVNRESEKWTEHCTGRIKLESAEPGSISASGLNMNDTTRVADAGSWYKKFAAIGLGYGSTFRPLSDIHADTKIKNQVSAKVALKTTTGAMSEESSYILHPASLDGAIQLGLIACHGGQADRASTAFVPVNFTQLYISTRIPQDLESATAVARGERRGLRGAYLDFVLKTSDGRNVLHVEGLRCTSYSRASQSLDKAYSSPFTRLLWKPDIRALNNSQLRQLYPPPPENVDRAPLWGVVNKLAYAIVYSIYETFAGDSTTAPEPKPSGEVGHFFEWIKRRGTLDDNEIRREFKGLSQKQRLARIDELISQAPHVIEVQTSKLLHDNMADILAERRTGIDVIISKNLLTPLYQEGLLMTGIYPQLFKVLDSLGHANPNMRYIEIGGGTGGATRIAMQAMRGPNGIKSYHDYTFTDISPGFLNTAREGLSGSGFDDMIYNVLDAEQDPHENGYEAVYDVVIACQVLHATSNMKKTLTNVGKLLKPGGKLVLVETTQNFTVPGVVVGTFTGYWAGIPDGRFDAPFMSQEKWDANLKSAGFTGTELVLDDFPRPHNTTSIIVSTFIGAPGPKTQTIGKENVQLLYSATATPTLLNGLVQEFKGHGVTAKSTLFQDAPRNVPSGSHVIVFLDDKHLQLDGDERDLAAFQYLARSTASLTILTSCGVAKGRNPDGALISGLLRVLKTENPTGQFLSIDIDGEDFDTKDDTTENGHLTRSIINQALALRESTASLDEENPADREFVWQDGALWVSRFVTLSETEISVPGEYYSSDSVSGENKTELLPIDSQGPVRATFETPGVLGSLYFAPDKDLWKPLPQGYIDVKIAAVGLDYDDLDVWSGRVDTIHGLSEYTGTVTAIGARVTGVKVGDRVYGLSSGQFRVGTSTRVLGALALKLQPEDDPVQLVTLPRSYSAVLYALEHIAHMPPHRWLGKTVLIQSATSNVGLAAAILAKAKGAEVFALVDNPKQAAFLSSETGISPSRILESDLRFAANAAEKGGFDVILSTTRTDSDFLYSAPQFLRPMGHLIHIGRIENQSLQTVAVVDFGLLSQKNATFSSVDLPILIDSAPALGRQLLQTIDGYLRQGLIKPIQIFTGAAQDAANLLRVLPDFSKLKGEAGKLVLAFTNPESHVKMLPPVPTARFDGEAAYVITGALGGLGQSIVQWMVDRGAKHLVLLSRRSIETVPDAQRLIDDLSNSGIDVRSIICDVTKKAELKNVIDKASSERLIKGVIHAAVSWRDLSFDKLSASRWQESLAAKVQGTKNLHEATLSSPLDFFVMTTSLLSVYALATQAAYTAANNFQDAFARHRRAQGLPASTVSFSLIRDVGATGSNSNTVDTFERNKTVTLSEKQFLGLFEPAFLKQTPTASQSTDPLSVANLITCLDPASMLARVRDGNNSGPTPRWHSDGRVAIIMRAFADAQQHLLDQNSSDGAGGGKSSVARLQQDLEAGIRAGPAERSATIVLVEGAITAMVADMLFIDLEAVDPSRSVADYGVDSLIAAELRNWFLEALKTDISMLKLLDQSTSMSTLAAKIVDDGLAQATTAAS